MPAHAITSRLPGPRVRFRPVTDRLAPTFSVLIVVIGATVGARGVVAAEPVAPAPTPAQVEHFEKRVRPLLVAQCFECHAGKAKKGGLRLDSRAAMIKGGLGGTALVPGDAKGSLLVRVMRHDGDIKMPPKGKLPDAAIADLAAWVADGAPWPGADAGPAPATTADAGKSAALDPTHADARKHWAFRPVSDPVPPVMPDDDWSRNEVDRFVLARLRAARLQPAAPAPKAALLRRVTFDLTGLPPTVDELAAFLADERPDALERVVDRLLASPAYGQRWARHWLDVARYADSNGLDENTAFGSAWRYRDWVVDALNADMPYDRFVTWQVAGDLLPPDPDPAVNHARLTATGFLSLGAKLLAEPDKPKMVMDIVDEQVDTLGKAVLGLTLGCARCHDHKFDPIGQSDYTAVAGIFKSTKTMATLATVARVLDRPLADPQSVKRAADHAVSLAAADAAALKLRDAARARAVKVVRGDAGGVLLAAGEALSLAGDAAARGAGSAASAAKASPTVPPASKPAPAKADPKAGPTVPESLARPAAEVAARRNLHAPTVQAVAERMRRLRTKPDGRGDALLGPWVVLDAVPSGEGWAERAKTALAEARSGPAGKAWLPAVAAAFEPDPTSMDDAADRWGRLLQRLDAALDAQSPAERARGKTLKDAGLEGLRKALADPKAPFALPADVLSVVAPEVAGPVREADAAAAKLRAATPPQPPVVHAVEDLPRPEDVRLNIRGSHVNLGAVVARGVPRILLPAGTVQPPMPADGSGRLQLAARLVAPDNPLTARVIVNRVWKHHFGEGLVRTPDNFGRLGEAPSHPELLDWLAARFVADGWSLKALHRRILSSSTWRMGTAADPGTAELASRVDPDNRLLHRHPRRRLEAEALRDAMLAVSGRLDATAGGTLLETAPFAYVSESADRVATRYAPPRRSLYLPVIRNSVHDVLAVFDFVEPSVPNGGRAVTTVAPQALFLMNGRLVAECADTWAGRLETAAPDEPARIDLAFRQAYSRPPTSQESAATLEFVRSTDGLLSATVTDPAKRRHAARRELCRVLLAANEFLMLD